MGKKVVVDSTFIDKVIDKHFSGLRDVLKKRKSKKRTQEIDAIFNAGKESLEEIIRAESSKKKEDFLTSFNSPTTAELTELENKVVNIVSMCHPAYTDDQIINAFKKVFSIKANQSKTEKEIIPLVVEKLTKITTPKKKNIHVSSEVIYSDLRGVM